VVGRRETDMGMLRKVAVLAGTVEMARRYARKNPEKVNRLADQASRFVNERTRGKYRDRVDSAVRKVREVTTREA
jgi:hypothetical protein